MGFQNMRKWIKEFFSSIIVLYFSVKMPYLLFPCYLLPSAYQLMKCFFEEVLIGLTDFSTSELLKRVPKMKFWGSGVCSLFLVVCFSQGTVTKWQIEIHSLGFLFFFKCVLLCCIWSVFQHLLGHVAFMNKLSSIWELKYLWDEDCQCKFYVYSVSSIPHVYRRQNEDIEKKLSCVPLKSSILT
jgi:hypothetical protein